MAIQNSREASRFQSDPPSEIMTRLSWQVSLNQEDSPFTVMLLMSCSDQIATIRFPEGVMSIIAESQPTVNPVPLPIVSSVISAASTQEPVSFSLPMR